MKLKKIIVPGIAAAGLIGSILSLNEENKAWKERDNLSNKEVLARYYDIEKQLKAPVTAREVFEQIDKYSSLRNERELLLNLNKDFYESKQKYDALTKKQKEMGFSSFFFRILSAGFGALSLLDFGDYIQKKIGKEKQKEAQ